MAEAGKKWAFGIGLYLVVKSVLNLILGFSGANIVMLILAVAALVLMLGRIPYIQYIVAVWLVLMFLVIILTVVQFRYVESKVRYQ